MKEKDIMKMIGIEYMPVRGKDTVDGTISSRYTEIDNK